MSRIYEALKKAEQEQGRSAHPERASGLGAIASSNAPPETEAPAASEHAPAPTQLLPESAVGVSELTLQALLAGCSRSDWHPADPKTLLSFNGHSAAHGPEEFRSLRSRLYQLRENHPIQAVLVTSALPREGKSFVAANLARVIVRQPERRALLIDGDLRSSHLHEMLGAPAVPGLSDYLLDEVDELAVIQWNPESRMFFIPGGKKMPNPSELLGNGRLKILVNRLAPLFTWMILDSPPMLPVSDARLLAAACDGVLLVVQANSTPFDLARKAQQEFREKSVLGVVLNRVEPRAGYSSYFAEYYDKQKKDRSP